MTTNDKLRSILDNAEKVIPGHVAIIMDGNRRWAKEKRKEFIFGHKKGAENVEVMVDCCLSLGVKYLTLYAFSSENWQREKNEVDSLVNLLRNYLNSNYIDKLNNKNIKISTIGDITKFDNSIQNRIANIEENSKNHNALSLQIALNYGSRDEITRATYLIAKQVLENKITLANIDNKLINNNLHTAYLPDVDLLIRTGGEIRISNFLLWQVAYAELYFTNILWPDFNESDFYDAILDFQKRNRRYGTG